MTTLGMETMELLVLPRLLAVMVALPLLACDTNVMAFTGRGILGVRPPDLTGRRGEILAIVGGSGSGKSVMLQTLIGLKRPEGGTIEVFGQEIGRLSEGDLREIQKRWGVLFQGGALFSALTVAQNVRVP